MNITPPTLSRRCRIAAQERRMAEDVRVIELPWLDLVRVICGGFFILAVLFMIAAIGG